MKKALRSRAEDMAVAMLKRIAYLRRGTPDETASIQDFAEEIRKQFTREELGLD